MEKTVRTFIDYDKALSLMDVLKAKMDDEYKVLLEKNESTELWWSLREAFTDVKMKMILAVEAKIV